MTLKPLPPAARLSQAAHSWHQDDRQGVAQQELSTEPTWPEYLAQNPLWALIIFQLQSELRGLSFAVSHWNFNTHLMSHRLPNEWHPWSTLSNCPLKKILFLSVARLLQTLCCSTKCKMHKMYIITHYIPYTLFIKYLIQSASPFWSSHGLA